MVFMSKNAFGQDDEGEYITGNQSQSSGGVLGSGGSSGNGYGASAQSSSLQQSNNQGRLPEGFVNMQRYVGQNQDDLLSNINGQGQNVRNVLDTARTTPKYAMPDLSTDQPDTYDEATLEKMAKLIWQKSPDAQQGIDFFGKATTPNAKIMGAQHVSEDIPDEAKKITTDLWDPTAAKTGSEGSYYFSKHMPITPAYSEGNQRLDDAIFGASGGRSAAKSNYDQGHTAMDYFGDRSKQINRQEDAAKWTEQNRADSVKGWGANYVKSLAGHSQQTPESESSINKLASLVGYGGPIAYAPPNPVPYEPQPGEEVPDDGKNKHVYRDPKGFF